MSKIKVNRLENTSTANGGIDIDTSGHVQVDGLQMPTAGALSNRNRIINGSMEVAQRGTSSTANGYVSLDRWYVNQSGGSTTFSQETFTVGEERSGLQNYAKFAVSASSDFTHIRQLIEDVKSIPAGSVTVSFDAKGTSPSGGLAVSLNQNFGSGGSTDVAITPQYVTLTSSWQRFNLTFTVPSISGKTVGAGNNFRLIIGQFSNTSATAWELNITGVQLEVGSKATPFEHESYGQTLAKCQRYFQTLNNTPVFNSAATGTGLSAITMWYSGNTTASCRTFFPVMMRVPPTAVVIGTEGDLTTTGNNGTIGMYYNGAWQSNLTWSVSATETTENSVRLNAGSLPRGVSGNCGGLYFYGTSLTSTVQLNAEL